MSWIEAIDLNGIGHHLNLSVWESEKKCTHGYDAFSKRVGRRRGSHETSSVIIASTKRCRGLALETTRFRLQTSLCFLTSLLSPILLLQLV